MSKKQNVTVCFVSVFFIIVFYRYFIGWQETLVVHPKTNKLTEKKRKGDTVTSQEPEPAKVAVTSGVDQLDRKNSFSSKSSVDSAGSVSSSYSSCPSCTISRSASSSVSNSVSDSASRRCTSKATVEKTLTSRPWRYQEEMQPQRIEGGRARTLSSSRSSPSISSYSTVSASSPSISSSASLSQLSKTNSRDNAKQVHLFSGPKSRTESGYSSLEKKAPALDTHQPSSSMSNLSPRDPTRRSQVMDQLEGDHVDNMDTSSSSESASSSASFSKTNSTRQTRSSRLPINKKQEQSLDSAVRRSTTDVSKSSMPRYRRSKSLDRRAADATPDLLNFKKGWMTKLAENGQWKKHWFVLTDHTLRFYRDAVAEEAADMLGEVNLSTCFDITDYPVQRNYGFQIHTADGVITLCAVTSGTRRNWVQAVMKNIRPTVAPDVTSSFSEQNVPPVLQDQTPNEMRSAEEDGDTDQRKNSKIRDRRREGRYKTFDWADFSRQKSKEEAEPRRQTLPLAGWDNKASGSPYPSSSSPASSPVASCYSSMASSSASQCLRETATYQEVEGKDEKTAPPMLTQATSTVTSLKETSDAETKTPTRTPTLHTQNKYFQRSASELDSGSTFPTPDMSVGHGDAVYIPTDAPVNVPSVDLSDCLVNRTSVNPGEGLGNVQMETTPVRQEGQSVNPISYSDQSPEEMEQSSDPQTLPLVKELERTLRELSRLQQVNISLEEQLQQEKEHNARESHLLQNGLLISSNPSSSAQACAWQRLQKLNQDLRFELEAQRSSQEEAQETELQRRAELIALQARALSAGEAASLACAELEQERQRFREMQEEGERDRRQEVERLRQRLQEVTTRLRATLEAQSIKEERLQKHLGLLQESQERERGRLGASLAHSECRMQDLQERLQRAEQQVETLQKGQVQDQPWAKKGEVAEAQQQLQEELARTLAAVERLQREGEQLETRCQELQNQLAEADGEVGRLRSRLQTEETDYYNLEHSYERVCEELQQALGQAQDRETAARESYNRLLERKEQELSEALVKMAALGSSLEETELKLNEAKEACTSATLPLSDVTHNELKIIYSGLETPTIEHSNDNAISGCVSDVNQAGACLCSVNPAYQYIVAAGDNTDRLVSVIQVLENKLHVTEEKLRDITQRLGEPQGQWSSSAAADPHIRSQLTQSRAATQRLSLLLHNQAKQSRRFALETEGRTKVLGRQCQAALATIEACRERIQALLRKPVGNSRPDLEAVLCALEMQMITAAACLRQGERTADDQLRECRQAQKEEEGLIEAKTDEREEQMCAMDDEAGQGMFSRVLTLEASVLEKIASILQIQDNIFCQTSDLLSLDGDAAHAYTDVLSKWMALETEHGKPVSGDTVTEESTIARVCVRAELAYIALTLQRRYQGEPLPSDSNNPTRLGSQPEELFGGAGDNKLSFGWARCLADVSPPELAPYEEQLQLESRDLVDNLLQRDQSVQSGNKAEIQPDQTERLAANLQKRANFLRQLSQEISSSSPTEGESSAVTQRCWLNSLEFFTTLLARTEMTYVVLRLQVDYDQELQRYKEACDNLQTMCQEQEATLTKERCAFSHNLSRLEEDCQAIKEKLEQAEQMRAASESESQRKVGALLADIESIEYCHEEQVEKLEKVFQGKIQELQNIHEEEMIRLHSHHACSTCVVTDTQHESRSSQTTPLPEKATSYLDFKIDSAILTEGLNLDGDSEMDPVSMATMKERIHELETQVNTMEEEAGSRNLQRHEVAMREAYQRDLENFKASCERGFTAMEAVHQKLVEDLQRQHQREVTTLLQERDRLLEEETAATVAAIEVMRNAHQEELERSQRSQLSRGSSEITALRSEYEVELQSLHRELEVLSDQYSQKCLESAQQNQAFEAQRQALLKCQKEKQELSTHKQELTQKLTEEISQMHSRFSGELSTTAFQGKDLYELEVILRVRDTELQWLKQETQSLKEELKAALRDKEYTTDKLKALYAEFDVSRFKVQCDITKSQDEVRTATGSPSDEECSVNSPTAAPAYGIGTSTNNPDFLKERSTLTRQIRVGRSKSLKEGLSVQERMKLFEPMD
ncbi:plectin isoform X1 [Esox lucius]|uniref:plectin isoform X1 n=1 Tax=Esox lucius TaxID=8010 RepID=UPI001476ADB8|nr:plectin isoform X1 [Esox lucius]